MMGEKQKICKIHQIMKVSG